MSNKYKYNNKIMFYIKQSSRFIVVENMSVLIQPAISTTANKVLNIVRYMSVLIQPAKYKIMY